MSRKVTKIPQARQYIPIEDQRVRVAAYCRVSTRHEEQRHSLEAQIAYYTNYIKRNPNWEFVAVYSDIASGVRTANRPGYRQLMRNCAKGKVDLVLVKSLSRFGRDALETIRQVRKLKRMNIGIYIEIGGLNTLDISDSIIDQLAALDQAESHFRSENIKFGIRHRMRSGKTVLNHTPKGRMAFCKLCRRKLRSCAKSLNSTSRVTGCARSSGILRSMGSKR